jgi:Ni,Fe-hydrogenase III small subunit
MIPPPLDAEALACAEVIFSYSFLGHVPRPADVMIVLGTNDTRVAEYAATLFAQGLAPRMIVTGGIAHTNDLLATNWDRSEAEVFADVLVAHGVPAEKMILEKKATNTAQNVSLSKRLIEKPASVLYVCKPFMPRRVYATHVVEWPEVPATVASWQTTFEGYCNEELPPHKILNIMMGDLQRLWIYARRGYSAPQRLPDEVLQAFRTLCEKGFTQHLVPGEPLLPK